MPTVWPETRVMATTEGNDHLFSNSWRTCLATSLGKTGHTGPSQLPRTTTANALWKFFFLNAVFAGSVLSQGRLVTEYRQPTLVAESATWPFTRSVWEYTRTGQTLSDSVVWLVCDWLVFNATIFLVIKCIVVLQHIVHF